MNPEHVSARNFRSWRHLDLELPNGCTAISGVNGAGKSSILLAVELALFAGKGELARHFSRDPDGDVVQVGLTFEHAGRRLCVRRAWSERARKGVLQFDEVLDDDVVSLTCETAAETQSLIERTLGLDRRTFRASSYIAQGDGAAFTAAQPRDRKDILAGILGLDVWDRLAQLARADRQKWTLEADTLRGRMQQLNAQLAEAPRIREELEAARRDAAADEELIAELRVEAAQAREQLEAARVADRMVEIRQTAFTAAQRSLREVNDQHERLRTQIREARDMALSPERRVIADRLPALEAEQMAVWEAQKQWRDRDAARQRAMREKFEAELRLQEARRILTGLEHARDAALAEVRRDQHAERCSTCGQVLDAQARELAVAQAQERAWQANDEIEVSAPRVNMMERAWQAMVVPDAEAEPQPRDGLLAELEQARHVAEAAARSDARLEMALRWEAEADAVNERVAELTAEQIQAEVALNKAQSARDANAARRALRLVELAESALQTAEQRYAEVGKKLAVLSDQNDALTRLADECDRVASDSYDAGEHAAAARLLERAYGRNGVPALIMEQSAIPAIEQTANRVLQDLGTSFTTTLRTQRMLKSGETADALDVVVHTTDGEALYEDLSGGERTRVDIALRLGLAQLLAHRSGAEVRLLAMDEPAHLDDEGMQRLAAILEHLDTAFDRVLLVSHVPTLGEAFDQRIVVERGEDDASVIVGAAEVVAA